VTNTGMGDHLGWANHLSISQATQANSASYSQWEGYDYQPKFGDAVRLGSKDRMAHSTCG